MVSGLSASEEPWLSAEPLRSSVSSSRAEKLFFLLLGKSCTKIGQGCSCAQLLVATLYSWQALTNELHTTMLQLVLV